MKTVDAWKGDVHVYRPDRKSPEDEVVIITVQKIVAASVFLRKLL